MKSVVIGVCVLSAASAVWAGPEWTEIPDAGNLGPTAQTPLGTGTLAGIRGTLTGAGPRGVGDFQDIFRIVIKDPMSFSAFVVPNMGPAPVFDSQLWLFDEFGVGVLGNTDAGGPISGLPGFTSISTDSSGSEVVNAGIYFLAISGAGSIPLDTNGFPIFTFGMPTEVSGPDGSVLPLGSWLGDGATGEYTISLTGASFVPAPASVALFGVAGFSGLRRRRR